MCQPRSSSPKKVGRTPIPPPFSFLLLLLLPSFSAPFFLNGIVAQRLVKVLRLETSAISKPLFVSLLSPCSRGVLPLWLPGSPLVHKGCGRHLRDFSLTLCRPYFSGAYRVPSRSHNHFSKQQAESRSTHLRCVRVRVPLSTLSTYEGPVSVERFQFDTANRAFPIPLLLISSPNNNQKYELAPAKLSLSPQANRRRLAEVSLLFKTFRTTQSRFLFKTFRTTAYCLLLANGSLFGPREPVDSLLAKLRAPPRRATGMSTSVTVASLAE